MLYRKGSVDKQPPERLVCMVRSIRPLAVEISTRELQNDEWKITATSMGGSEIWSSTFRAQKRVTLIDVRDEIRASALARKMCTYNSELKYTLSRRPCLLRGNSVIKAAFNKKPMIDINKALKRIDKNQKDAA